MAAENEQAVEEIMKESGTVLQTKISGLEGDPIQNSCLEQSVMNLYAVETEEAIGLEEIEVGGFPFHLILHLDLK